MKSSIAALLVLVFVAAGAFAGGQGEAGQAEPVEIVFQHWTTNMKEIWDTEIAFFEQENPNVTIVQEILPYGDYWSKLPIAMAGGEGPDIYQMTRPNFEPFAAAGRAAALDELVDNSASMQDSLAALEDRIIDVYRYKGELMGVPITVESTAMVFNKTLFEEAGLTLPTEIEDTWTWDDMREMALALTKVENGETVQYGLHVIPNRLPTFDFIWSNGGELYSDDGTQVLAGSPEAIQTMEYLTSLVVEDRVSPSFSYSQTVGAFEHFMSGTVGMIPAGSWMMATLRQITDFEWDVAEFPRSPFSGERRVASNVVGLILGPNSDNPAEAVEVMAAFTKQRPMMAMAETGANTPARNDSRAPYFDVDVPANAEAYQRALDYIRPMILSEYVSYPETLRILTADALEKLYNGREPVDVAWVEAVREIEGLLEERVD